MRKSGEERRQEIVAAVIELAAEEGTGRITAQAIADRIGIAQPTVFRHFKTRERILEAVIEWIARQLLGVVGGIAAGSGPADERLKSLLESQLAFISRHRGLPRLLFSERLHQENTRLKRSVARIMDAYTTTVSGLLAEGVASGVFRDDVDPDESARLILAMIQGLIMRWSVQDFRFDLPGQAPALWRMLEPALMRR